MAERESDKNEIDLIEILRKIIAVRKTIYKAAGLGLIVGIIVAISIPKQYTVNVTLSPEIGTSKGGNALTGLATSFLGGTSIRDGSDALNASLSGDIVSSTPFLLELWNMQIMSSKGKNILLNSYLDTQSSPWWNYVIGFPEMVIGSVKSLFSDKKLATTGSNKMQGTIELNVEESRKLALLKNAISASIDKETAVTTVTVSFQDPKITAIVADSVVHKLQEFIINYRTSKAKEDCVYLEKLFKERQREYYEAQKRYAHYVDSHDNLVLQSVRTEQERLQNDMSLAYQVYSQVANQLQVARAKVQEEKPVFAVVEPAVVPLRTSGPGLKVYILVFVFLFVMGTVGWILIGQEFWDTLKSEKKTIENSLDN